MTKKVTAISLWLLGATFCLIAVSACSRTQAGMAEDLTVEEFRYQLLPSGARIVSGQVRNTGNQIIQNAQVQISLFDDENRKVSSMIVHVPVVEAGQSAAFREPVTAKEDVRGARVRSVIVL